MRTILTSGACLAAVLIAGCQSPSKTSPPQAQIASPPEPVAPIAPLQPAADPPSHSLAKGTSIAVKLLAVVDSSALSQAFIPGSVANDVNGSDGHLAIPAGSPVVLAPRYAKKTGAISEIGLGLYAVTIGAHQYAMTDGATDAATVVLTEDAGKGTAHSSIHLQYGTSLDFKLDRAVQLR